MMNSTITLDQALETVMQLSTDQQDMLVDILHSRRIEQRRREMAVDAQASIAAFHQGKFKPQSVDEIVLELRRALDDDA